MSNIFTKELIVFGLGLLVFSAYTGIAAGQSQGAQDNTSLIFTNMSQEIIPPDDVLLPAQATADFKIIEDVEVNVDNNVIPSGYFTGRQWGDLNIRNTQDSSQTVLRNISETMEGDSFTSPEFAENATWNSTHIHWVYPPDFAMYENDSFSSSYHTGSLTTIFNPVTLKRFVNQSIFSSEGYQFNSYELNFTENTYDNYLGILKFEENLYSNSSILYDTFTTDLPLLSQKNGSYLHPITKIYVSEINYTIANSSIELNHPYHINFTAVIRPINNAGSPERSYPRVMFALARNGAYQPGDQGLTAIMPSALLPAHVTCATATTDVVNIWRYRHDFQLKVAFNQTSTIIGREKISVFRNSNTWLLDASGNGAYGAGDVAYVFGKAGDVPVTGDWNADGKTEIGVVRNSNTWLLDASGNGAYGAGDVAYVFGKAGDVPVTGDWNADGKTEIGVVRNSNTWLLDASGNGAYGAGDLSYVFGKAGDVPVAGDWNTDGKTEIGVVRNSNTWLLDASGNGMYGAGDLSYVFGKAGDKYVTGKWS